MKNFSVLLIGFLLFLSGSLYSQVLNPVKWSFSHEKVGDNLYELRFTANIDKGWQIYGTVIDEGGPIPTSVNITETKDFRKKGNLNIPKPVEKHDPFFDMKVTNYSGKVTFRQVVEVVSTTPFKIAGDVEFMSCDDVKCLPPDFVDFSFSLPGKTATTAIVPPAEEIEKKNDSLEDEISGSRSDYAEEDASAIAEDAVSAENDIAEITEPVKRKSFWGTFITGLLGGLLALLTPCVFPMIPLTVSFFLRNANNKARAFRDAMFYGLTIVFAYVVLGLAISMIFGSDALQNLAVNQWFNLFFFALLVFFAASFFGAFELTLPSSWSNALDQKAEKTGGLIGVIIMGLTFVLVSFSCTGPIVGSLLVEAATSGDVLSPAIGMLGFSLALAIPFSLFAIFPSAMQSLPRSGGWMNAVKVVLGFIVLAFALKFLATADAAAQWGILDREVFIVLWIAIFLLLGLYLIGKIKFAHDSDLKYLSVPRLILAVLAFAFVFYLVPGLWGAPLKAVSSFLPSPVTQDFDLSRAAISGSSTASVDGIYTGLSVKPGPHGLMTFTDYDEAMAAAKKAGKPLFLDFTGYTCSNCRKMEANVWSDQQVLQMLANDFVIVALYTDDRTRLPEEEQFRSSAFGTERLIRTVGEKKRVFQVERYKTNAVPYYIIIDHDENALTPGYGYDSSIPGFLEFLNSGKEKFENK
jgi:thiol:disulfide interchange protein DsbD